MSRRLTVEPEAERDISDGYGWYESRRIGLGTLFLDEVGLSLSRITDNPFSFSEVEVGIRRAIVHVYPYLIFYRLSDEEVRVIAVLPAAQDPEFIRSKLR